jgi:myo-inositol-1(or 4)-monophosphatase
MLIKKVAEQSLIIVKDTADYIRNARMKLQGHEISYKPDKSLVTAIDLGAEERLVSKLGALIPKADFLAEEKYKDNPNSDLMWIIDPIDGTTNFVHNLPMYSISVALWHNGKIVIGIIYEITSQECFWTHSEIGPVYINNSPIRVSLAKTLSESVLATGFPPRNFPRLNEYFEHFKYFMTNTHGIRRLGSAAMDLAYVACGRCDGFFEYNLSPWDVAAGAYLVQKAGGTVTDFSGGGNFLHGGEILASNTWIHKEFIKHFSTEINEQQQNSSR